MTAQGEKKLKVFLVEDTPAMATGITELLVAGGRCEIVGTALSEREAIEWSLFNEAGFDVAILDLLLRDGSGFAVLAHLAKYQPGQVVVLSGYVTPVIRDRCLAMGALAAFSKTETAECMEFVRGLQPRAG